MSYYSLNIILRVFALGIFLLWWLYWRITEKEADKRKPKQKSNYSTLEQMIRYSALTCLEGLLIVQIMGLTVLPFQASQFFVHVFQGVGFLCIVIGVCVAISARKTLGANWAHAFEYQVKKNHELVTTGVYAYIRHPIYTGLVLSFFGGELLVQSYVVFLGFVLLYFARNQMRREETILIAHFGKVYKKYMQRTKMFLPFLW